jgi:hypothetical protein
MQPIVKNGVGYKHQDELDLVNLIQKAVSFVYRFRIILITSLLTGLALGLYFYYSSPRQYSTRLIVRPWSQNQTGFLSNQEEIEIVNNWKELLVKGEKDQLANIINCDVNIITKLNSISAEEIIRTYVPNNPNGFLINVSVTDTSVLDALQNGIVYGLNNSPFIKDKIEIRKRRNAELVAKLNTEIVKLNSTKGLVDSMIKTKAANPSSLLVDISRINTESIELNEKMLGYQEDSKFLSGVQVLENFTKGKLSRSGFLKFSFLGMAAGCFIGYVISLLLYVKYRIKKSNAEIFAST